MHIKVTFEVCFFNLKNTCLVSDSVTNHKIEYQLISYQFSHQLLITNMVNDFGYQTWILLLIAKSFTNYYITDLVTGYWFSY